MRIMKKKKKVTPLNITFSDQDHVIIVESSMPVWLEQHNQFLSAQRHQINLSERGIRLIGQPKRLDGQPLQASSSTSSYLSLIDYYGDHKGQIRLLVLNQSEHTIAFLKSSSGIFNRRVVDYIWVEAHSSIDPHETVAFLLRHGYHAYSLHGGIFKPLNFRRANGNQSILAVSDRISGIFSKTSPSLDLFIQEMAEHGIQPKGVLHVGAHEGKERDRYREKKISPIIFVEANPDLARSLAERFSSDKDVVVVQAAAADRSGEAIFNITSMDQSSSLLNLKQHLDLYPKIGVEKKIKVRTETIDNIVSEAKIRPEDINLLVMDIQGAELLALQGAIRQLQNIEAIQLEVNYSELYEGCPLIHDIDEFLDEKGFSRVKTSTPFSEQWGDALYVRTPKVTFSKLGTMGRFANQAFQYLFLQTYAKEHGYLAVNPKWCGDDMFNVAQGVDNVGATLSQVRQTDNDHAQCEIASGKDSLPNRDISGFFQYHMGYYKWRKSEILREFEFKDQYKVASCDIDNFFRTCGRPVAAIHLRRGDYGFEYFFIPPNAWYKQWLTELKRTNPNLIVFIASDDLEAVQGDFAEFDVWTAKDIPLSNPSNISYGFFVDFCAMVHADFLATSNSTFSFLAALLNVRSKLFVRPDLGERQLVSFDPWNSTPLLREHMAEHAGAEFMSEQVRLKRQRKLLRNRMRRTGSKLIKMLRR